MHLFMALSVPLAFLSIGAWFFDTPTRRSTRVQFVKGALVALPAIGLWLLLSFLYKPIWGSGWLMYSFAMKFWILPLGLGCVAAVFLVKGPSDHAGRRAAFTSFFAGYSSVFSLAHLAQVWGEPTQAYHLLLPLLLLTATFATPLFLIRMQDDYMPPLLRWVAALLGIAVVGAVAFSSFFLRIEALGWILSALYLVGTGWLVVSDFRKA